MIKIISGVYGYRNEKGVYEPKTSKSEPFSLPEAEEKRLIDRKVAVDMSAVDKPENNPGKPKYDDKMKANKLGEMMKSVGLTPQVGMSKVEMVAALDEYYARENDSTADDTDGDTEPDGSAGKLPDLGAENVVT